MTGSDPRTEPKPDLSRLDSDTLLRELAKSDPSFTEGAAIYQLVNKIGGLLRQMRNSAQLTQSGLAERLGVSQGRISQIESGLPDHAPSVEMIARIALACGFTPQINFDPTASSRAREALEISAFRLADSPPAPAPGYSEVKHGGSS